MGKEEKGKRELIEKDIATKDAEIKKQRKVYGGKMDEVRVKLDEAKAEEAVSVSKLIASEVARKELVTRLNLKEKEIIEIKEKTRLENQKQKLGERIVSWKTKAELEENKKLKLTIDHKLAEQEVEAAEERSTELLVELTSIRLRHDTELNDIKKLHDRLMKEEK